ncbi:MAG TPA: c-type cytochrome domain-containing protein [Gemmataceae bacterium]|jgi:mono/diheme cytochrome c family protein|nr:c-type cytochrome domain-containing protein [Gemmataceae bacterium]
MRKILSLACAGIFFAIPVRAADVDFEKEIKPIFENTCIKCHGPETAKNGLRLDSKAAMLKGSKDEKVVTPGKSAESSIYKLISLPDADGRMPKDQPPLSKEQIEKIKLWIDQGAKWPEGLVLKAATSSEPKTDAGVAITDAEKAGLEKLQKAGVLAIRLAQNTNLLRVDFSLRGKEVKDDELALLKDMPNLVELNLGGTNITDTSLNYVKPLVNLTRLQLHNTKITDAGLGNLTGLTKLTSLNLYGTTVTDQGVQQLQGLKNLKNLYLYLTKVTPPTAKKLAASTPGLDVNIGADLEPPPPPKVDPPKKDEKKADAPKKDEKKLDAPKKDEKPKADAPKKDDKPKDDPAKKDEKKKEEKPKDDKLKEKEKGN